MGKQTIALGQFLQPTSTWNEESEDITYRFPADYKARLVISLAEKLKRTWEGDNQRDGSSGSVIVIDYDQADDGTRLVTAVRFARPGYSTALWRANASTTSPLPPIEEDFQDPAGRPGDTQVIKKGRSRAHQKDTSLTRQDKPQTARPTRREELEQFLRAINHDLDHSLDGTIDTTLRLLRSYHALLSALHEHAGLEFALKPLTEVSNAIQITTSMYRDAPGLTVHDSTRKYVRDLLKHLRKVTEDSLRS